MIQIGPATRGFMLCYPEQVVDKQSSFRQLQTSWRSCATKFTRIPQGFYTGTYANETSTIDYIPMLSLEQFCDSNGWLYPNVVTGTILW